MSAIALRSISKRYGDVWAVTNVSFEAEQGEFLTLLGPSGCGKTTTLRMIAGFVTPTTGAIEVNGKDVTAVPPFRRDVGLVFQSYALFPHMSVADNVGFGLKMRKLAEEEIRKRVHATLAMVRLESLSGRYPNELSGGQQQRVALARALIIRPQLLLLDEPLGALDRQLRDHMRLELRSLQQSLRLPTIFVTHDQSEALSMSDRIAVMNEGRIEQIGVPSDIYERPVTSFVATFLGRSNVIELELLGHDGAVAHLGRGNLRVPTRGFHPSASGKRSVLIRPERVEIIRAHPGETNVNIGRVQSTSYLGASIDSIVAIEDVLLEVSTPNRGGSGFLPTPGDEVLLTFPADAVWPLQR